LEKDARIFVAGADKMIGAAIAQRLQQDGYANVLGAGSDTPELTNAVEVDRFFALHTPDYVFLAAGRSGGIMANQKFPADLIYDNLMTECNVINSAHKHGVSKLLYLASSCVYPKHCPQPMRPDSLMTGKLEPTNEPYAVAKLAGLQLCQAYRSQHGADFICGIPADAFGPGAHFDPQDSHVIPALIYKMHEARVNEIDSVELWGTGKPEREFIYADDIADACVFVMTAYSGGEPINLGGGKRISIGDLALAIKDVVGYGGELSLNTNKPDGMPIKGLDSTELLDMGWAPKVDFYLALQKTYESYLQTKQAN
jgi:GDP-L-fucose synthase